MATALSKLATTGKQPKDRRTVVDYATDVHLHQFRDKDKNLTGEEAYVFRVLPKLSDGSTSGVGLWVWLEGPDALRALRGSLARIAREADMVDATMVEAGEWPARPKPAVEAPAPKAEAKPKSPLSKLAAAKEAAIADGLGEDLPF